MSDTTTRGIRIQVESEYSPDRSDPQRQVYFFTYHIRITNQSMDTVQLINRHWKIMDGNGHTEEVNGAGVVGKQPLLTPGDIFEYTSFCPLKTPMGSMQGHYEMKSQNGQRFKATIGKFNLKTTYTLH